jgi:hypothetical protein
MFKLRKLNASGVAHHAVLMLAVVIAVAGIGAYLVSASHADNVYTFRKPNGCIPGKLVGPNGGCNWMNDQTKLATDCAQYHLQYSGGQCQLHCLSGWYISATTGDCQQLQNPPTGGTGGGGTGGGGTTPTPPTEAQCAALNRRNEDKTNNHCEECYDAYLDGDGDVHTFSDKCIKKPITTTTTDGAGAGGSSIGSGGTSGTGGTVPAVTTDNAAVVACTAQHKKWHTASKICGPECATGFGLTEGKCVAGITTVAHTTCDKVATPDGNCVNENRIKSYCDSRHLKLTDNGNNCQLDCVKGYTLMDTDCVKKSTGSNEGDATPSILALDTTMDKATCAALGREWDNHAVLEDGTIGKGCATNQCDKKDAVLLTQQEGVAYCKGYLSKITLSTCNDLHRNWVAAASGCMSNPKKKDTGARLANAPECDKKHSTYVFKAGEDECFSPAVIDRLSAVAQATGKPITALAHLSQAQLCNLQPHKHWNGSKCVEDKPAQTTSGGASTPNSDPTPTGNTSLARNGKSWDTYCATLGRYVSGHCGGCKYTDYMLYSTDAYGWRRCMPKKSVCTQDGGTKICGDSNSGGNHGCPVGQQECGDTTPTSPAPSTYHLTCTDYKARYATSASCTLYTNTHPDAAITGIKYFCDPAQMTPAKAASHTVGSTTFTTPYICL